MRRVGKRSVNYRMATSMTKCCGTCVMYHVDKRRCDLVRGDITISAVCDRWRLNAR